MRHFMNADTFETSTSLGRAAATVTICTLPYCLHKALKPSPCPNQNLGKIGKTQNNTPLLKGSWARCVTVQRYNEKFPD